MIKGLPKTIVKRTRRLEIRPYRISDFASCKRSIDGRLPQQNAFDLPAERPENLNLTAFREKLIFYRYAWRRDLLYIFGIFNQKTGEAIGRMDIAPMVRLNVQSANLGYFIHNQYWKNGYGKEAGIAVIKIAFQQLHLHRIECAMDPENKASQALARSLGMTCEGLRPSFYYENRKWTGNLIYSLVPEDIGLRSRPPQIRLSLKDDL